MSSRDTFGRAQKSKHKTAGITATSSAAADNGNMVDKVTHLDPIRFAEAHAKEIFAIESALQVASYDLYTIP